MVGRCRVPVRSPVRKRSVDGTWSREPSVGEVLEDPIVAMMMARDRVAADDIRRLIAVVRRSRQPEASDPPAI